MELRTEDFVERMIPKSQNLEDTRQLAIGFSRYKLAATLLE
jgi:hypothetical protein